MKEKAHPPVRMEEGEREIVNDAVGVIVLVWVDLHTNAETLQAQVKVGAYSAFYTHCVAYVLLAVVAMVERPAASTHSQDHQLNLCQTHNPMMLNCSLDCLCYVLWKFVYSKETLRNPCRIILPS